MSVRVMHVVATDQRRGAEVFASGLVRVLADLGVDQRVVVLRGHPADADADADAGAIRFDAPTTRLAQAGRSRTGLGQAHRLRREIHAYAPDVLQVHGGEAMKAAALARTKVPLVYRRIGGVPPWLSSGPRRWVYGRLMRRAATVVAVAESVREETIAVFGLPAGAVVTIPNGVDQQTMTRRRTREAVRHELGIPSDAAVSISLAALVPEKDPLGVLELLMPYLRDRPDAVHLFVGTGPMIDELRTRAEFLSPGSVRCLGERTDVADILGAADLLLFASPPGGMEGMPASLIEAGLCGLPTVGFDVAGAREVVDRDVTGYLGPWRDAAALRARMARLMDDAPSRVAMGIRAKKHCARFDIRAVAPRYLQLYRGLTA